MKARTSIVQKLLKQIEFFIYVNCYYQSVEKMEISHQDTHLALILPTVCIRGCLRIYGMFTRDRVAGQSWGVLARRGWRGNIHSLLSSWHLIGWTSTSDQRDLPTEFLQV